MFSKTLLAYAAFLTAVSALPSNTVTVGKALAARAEGGVVTGVPADPVQFSGTAGKDAYVHYQGDGSEAAGWPNRQSWVSFETMFNNNKHIMQHSCDWMNVPNSSDQEINDIHAGILQASDWAKVDPRFILAVLMQESNGCVRVHTTGNGVRNPGLMQDHDGAHSCNDPAVGGVLTPCPKDQITFMISDGTGGTKTGDGLAQIINAQAQNTGIFSAWPFYKAARVYNSGSIAAGGDLNNANGATASYACDIANRLMGWTDAPSTFA